MIEHCTFFVPVALAGPANQLAMVAGEGPADARTYDEVFDGPGGVVHMATHYGDDAFFARLNAPNVRPAWDTAETIDIEAAVGARMAVVVWRAPVETDPDAEPEDPGPTPAELLAPGDKIVAVIGPDVATAMALAGVSRAVVDEGSDG